MVTHKVTWDHVVKLVLGLKLMWPQRAYSIQMRAPNQNRMYTTSYRKMPGHPTSIQTDLEQVCTRINMYAVNEGLQGQSILQ